MIYDVWLVQALTIGVDYQTFWTLNPRKLTPFVEAYKQKQEYAAREFREKANFSAWLQGVYIARAIAVNFAKNASYFDQPIMLSNSENSEEDVNGDAVKFECWAKTFNQQFHSKKSEE